MNWKPEMPIIEAHIFAHSHKHESNHKGVFCTILEEIPLYFPGLQMSGIDQSKRIVDLDKDCDQFP